MKTMTRISFFVFFMGLLLKFFQLNFNTIIMLLGLSGMLIGVLGSIFSKEKKEIILVRLASFCWLTLLLFSVKFFPNSIYVLAFSGFVSIIALVLIVKTNRKTDLIQIALFSALALGFYFTPTDSRYHLLSIRWNLFIDSDHITWDKYSWFLYQNNKHDEALNASKRAKALADQNQATDWLELIAEHSTAIEDRNWTQYSAIRH